MNLFKLAGNIVVNGREAIADIERVGDKAEDTTSRMQKKFRSVGKKLGTAIKAGALVAGAAIAGLAVKSTNEFANFEQSMNEVYTLIPNASEEMRNELSEDIRAVGEQFGFLTDDTVPALYQALSAGVPPDNVMSFMDQAAQAAKAGVTDLQTSVDGLTSAVNAYGQDVLSAEKASDILFTTVKEGKTTFPELAQNMSNVTPIAAALGVSFEGINAALATMTAQGMDTGKATIYLRAMLNQLSKSGSDANNVFKEMAGVTFTEFIDQGNSLADALQLMEDYADENNTTIKKLFSNIRAGTGALQLTGANMGTFIEKMDEMENSAGSTEKAYGEMSESVQQALDELRAWWQNQQIAIGEKLEQPLRDLLEFLRNNEDEISDLIQNTFTKILDGLKWMINHKGKTVAAIKGIGIAFATWKLAALVGPLGAIVTSLGIIAGYEWYKLITGFKANVGDTAESILGLDENIRNTAAGTKLFWERLDATVNKLKSLKEEGYELSKSEKAILDFLTSFREAHKEEREFKEDVISENAFDILKQSLEDTDNTLDLSGPRINKALDLFGKKELSLSKNIGKNTLALEDNATALGQEIHQTVETMKVFSDEEDNLADLYKGYGKLAKARAKANKTVREQRENEEDAQDVKEERLDQLDKEIAKHEALGEEYDETEMKAEAYKDIVEELIDAELESTDVYDKIIDKLKSMQGEIKNTKSAFEEFWKANKDWMKTTKDAFMDFFYKVNEEGKSTAQALEETFVESADEIAGEIAYALTGSRAIQQATNWLVDLGKAAWDWLFGPSKAQKKINKMAEDLQDTFKNSLQGAFSADTYEGFVSNFGTSIEEAVKTSMIKAFMTTEYMKHKLKKLSRLIAEATAPGSAGGVSVVGAEKSRIQREAQAIMNTAKPYFEMIKDFDLGYGGGEGDVKTGTFGAAPGGGGTTTIQTRNLTPDVIEKLGDTVKDQGTAIKAELEEQTALLKDNGKAQFTIELDREVLARKIFELKNTRLRAMGVS